MTEKCKAIFKGKDIPAAAYLLASAFLLIMLASRSSFLYPCNNWNDANSYFSVGKALFNGKMPYRDVFDQKGMYLYFFTAWLIWCLTLPLQACSSLKFCLRLLIWQESAGFYAFM